MKHTLVQVTADIKNPQVDRRRNDLIYRETIPAGTLLVRREWMDQLVKAELGRDHPRHMFYPLGYSSSDGVLDTSHLGRLLEAGTEKVEDPTDDQWLRMEFDLRGAHEFLETIKVFLEIGWLTRNQVRAARKVALEEDMTLEDLPRRDDDV